MDALQAKSLELTKEVLRIASPKELILVDSFDPSQSSYGVTSKGPLGFGVEAAGMLLLPIAYKFFETFFTEVGREAGGEIVKTLKAYIAARSKEGVTSQEELASSIKLYLQSRGVSNERLDKTTEAIIAAINLRADDFAFL